MANHPVTSTFEKEVFAPQNGFVTANHRVVYSLNGVPVLTRHCQVLMRPDESEATVTTWESTFGDELGRGDNRHTVLITREQFGLLAEMWQVG